MNVNGSRHQMLLGEADWGRCLDGDDAGALTLRERWAATVASPGSSITIPDWDRDRHELHVAEAAIVLPPTPSESPLSLAARRCAASDRFGNVYFIGPARADLRVRSSGSARESRFWPATDDAPPSPRADFQPAAAAAATLPVTMLALAVTEDHYLVVAFARGDARGFLAFDLAAGGPPVETAWPDAGFAPFDMAARGGGGVWILERDASRHRLWELDRRLSVVSRAQTLETIEPAALDDFQPLAGPPREIPARTFPGGIELLSAPVGAIDPIALEVLGCGRVLLLDLDATARRHRVLSLARNGDALQVAASSWFDGLAHDFVAADAIERPERTPSDRLLFVTTVDGNQAFAHTLVPEPFALHRVPDLFPLRLYAGRALLAVHGRAHYDSGVAAARWTPVVQQPRARFHEFAEFVTPVFDAREPGTTWDRLMLDARLPAGTTLEIESRAADDRRDFQVLAPWRPEPAPVLRGGGSELPWLREEAARVTQRSAGLGTWEVLFQEARGRYLQLRIRLRSDHGASTPRLRALRVWSPRFSWSQRFLPAVYREEAAGASFVERWLANFEGTLTGIEDRIANAQALFDPRTAPASVLDWFVRWFDIAFDPAWDERRRRLFTQRIMDFFRWRGTTHGLRMALELAFDDCLSSQIFDGPVAERPQSVRIVESFATRLSSAAVAGDPGRTAVDGPREVVRAALWSPAEGNAGLADRFARARGETGATPQQEIEPFPLVPPDAGAARWRDTALRHLGFVPTVGADERAHWRSYREARNLPAGDQPVDWPAAEADRALWRTFVQMRAATPDRHRWTDFLARRYRRIGELNRAWRTGWPAFELVALPAVLPATRAAQVDWLQFEGLLLAMHRSAHRFSVLLPVRSANEDPAALDERLRLAQRIVDLEKPAHTVFDVRLYWALNRVGEARLGVDTLLGQGSRAPELIPHATLGRAYVGASFVAS
jgi:phage tail-like protein